MTTIDNIFIVAVSVVGIVPFCLYKIPECIYKKGKSTYRKHLCHDARECRKAKPKPLKQSFRPDFQESHDSEINEQLRSPLFRLPREIRDLIWSYTLTNQVIHIVPTFGRFCCVVCTEPSNHMHGESCLHDTYYPDGLKNYKRLPEVRDCGPQRPSRPRWPKCFGDQVNVKNGWLHLDNTSLSEGHTGASIMRTCRLAHNECSPLFYSSNTFSIPDLQWLRTFYCAIPENTFQKFRKLELVCSPQRASRPRDTQWLLSEDDWKNQWSCVPWLLHLQNLTIFLEHPGRQLDWGDLVYYFEAIPDIKYLDSIPSCAIIACWNFNEKNRLIIPPQEFVNAPSSVSDINGMTFEDMRILAGGGYG